MSQKQKVELSGSKTEGIYDCFAAHLYCLWLTRWLLIDSFWIHFFKSVKGKLMCSGHEKTKTTFTQLLLILQLLVLVFFCTIILFWYICELFFVQKSTNVFVGYTNAALMRFATILKVRTIVHANMDLPEVDENVKVGVGFISNNVMKK